MTEQILLGKHLQYTDGYWIVLNKGNDKNDYEFWKRHRFVLKRVKTSQDPLGLQGLIFRKNPYSTQKGFGLRVYRAEQAIKN